MKRVFKFRYLLPVCIALAICTWTLIQPAQSDEPAKSGSATSSQPTPPMPQISTAVARKKKPASAIPKPTVVLKPGEAPKPQFDALEHDFGTVWSGAVIQHEFKFKNTGTGPLEILVVKPGCGCTTYSDFDKIVQPGAEGKIPIKVDTAKFQGPISKSVTVHTNATGIDNMAMLVMKGNVKPLFLVEPAKLEFGAVKLANVVGKTLTKSVIITNQTEKPLHLTNIRTSNPNFKVAMKELEPGNKYEVVVDFGGAIRTASNGTAVELDTNFPEMPGIRIPAAVFVEAPIEITPSQLALTTSRKVPFTRAFFVQNNTQKAEALSDLRVSNSNLNARLEETTPGMAWKVVLDVPVDYEASQGGDTISIKTSNPEIPELIVDIVVRPLIANPAIATTQPTVQTKEHDHEHAGHEHWKQDSLRR